jgi:fatty acid synthase
VYNCNLDESILIHSGTGGVGQAAIAVCQYYNCDIYTTVGNEEKRQYLMSKYNIPKDHIFSSRDTQFEYELMTSTKGKGVDIVINSLIGDKLQASFRCVADDGRFVEIGKYDLQMNKQLGLFSFLRNIMFIGVAINTKPDLVKKYFDWIHSNATNGCVKPINTSVFNVSEAITAFRYVLH